MMEALKEEKRADVVSGKSERGDKQSQAIAFVLFRPKSKVTKERLCAP